MEQAAAVKAARRGAKATDIGLGLQGESCLRSTLFSQWLWPGFEAPRPTTYGWACRVRAACM